MRTVQPDDSLKLGEVAGLLNSAWKIVVVVGVGISTNAGIPVSLSAISFYPLLTRLGFSV
jgi:NAD-dependent SIR2 family protein deacetylase